MESSNSLENKGSIQSSQKHICHSLFPGVVLHCDSRVDFPYSHLMYRWSDCSLATTCDRRRPKVLQGSLQGDENGLRSRVGFPLSCRDPDSDFGPALIRSQCLHHLPCLFVLEFLLTTLGNLAVQCFSLKILHKLQSVCWEKIVRRWRSIRRSDGEKEFPHKERSGLRLTDSF